MSPCLLQNRQHPNTCRLSKKEDIEYCKCGIHIAKLTKIDSGNIMICEGIRKVIKHQTSSFPFPVCKNI